jgi:tetratricopeptide (TPR) repeat protein
MALHVTSLKITDEAINAELEEDLKRAATLYEQAIKEKPTDEFSYNRLMIVYRKLKQYKDELRVINKAIKNFKEAHAKKIGKGLRKNSTVGKLSTALMKTAGLLDKKGNAVYVPEPIARWEKRKLTVEKRLKK